MEYKFRQILNIICNYYNIKLIDLLSKKRNEPLNTQRHIAITLLYEAEYTSSLIGKIFSRHYSTIMHAVYSIKNRIINNRNIKQDFDNLEIIIDELYSRTLQEVS